jgi:hypothetical protein
VTGQGGHAQSMRVQAEHRGGGGERGAMGWRLKSFT